MDLKIKRTAEVQDIIERMPTNFGRVVSVLIIAIFLVLILLGCFINYPDIVTGQLTINANKAPIKLVAHVNGKLKLIRNKSQEYIKEGDYLAYIENSARLNDVRRLSKFLTHFNINSTNYSKSIKSTPKKTSLGELNTYYFAFINSLQQLANHETDNLFAKRLETLKEMLLRQKELLEASRQKQMLNQENLQLVKKFHTRDSVLLAKKVLSSSDFDRTNINYLTAKEGQQNVLKEIILYNQQIEQTESEIQKTQIEETEKLNQMNLDLASTYTNLIDNLKLWEEKYVFKSPINGKIQFLNFWTNEQFIQAGEPIFSIVPQDSEMLGQVNLPALGAGKVKVGQEVIIKLDNYPYQEYGSIKGKVNSISLTTNPVKTEKGVLETYLILVDLPQQLKTNYGAKLKAKFEIKGTAEIVTHKRRLFERLFDNLSYAIKR